MARRRELSARVAREGGRTDPHGSTGADEMTVRVVFLDGTGSEDGTGAARPLDPVPSTRVVHTYRSDEFEDDRSRVLLEAAASSDIVLLVGEGSSPARETIRSLVSAIRSGADAAVANSEAGRRDPTSFRRRAGRWLVRTLLQPVESLHELAELRGGCHAYRSSVLKEVLPKESDLLETGEGVLVEILLRLSAVGGRVVQIPVEPGDAPRLGGWTVLKALVRHRRRVCQIARARAMDDRLKELVEAASRAARSDTACRVMSIVVASAGIVVTLPLMVVIAVLVKVTSPGPIIFTQTRVGLDRRDDREGRRNRRRQLDLGGKPFNLYKFRTMYADYGNQDQVWAEPDDPRVTPVGRVLRKFRLDELPQLFNVLAGDMNIVGPRPEQPKIALKLRSEIEGYQIRHRVPPGITGRAQVYLNYDRDLDDVRRKVAYDLEYLARRSVREDVEIMVRTIPVVIFRQGAW